MVSSGQKLKHRKKAMANHHCASEIGVVNKFSISLVCGLRAQAADTVTFCFCL